MNAQDETELTPDNRRLFDRLMKAGWLEQLTDLPHDANKGLHWVKYANSEHPDGYSKLLAFNLLYAELCKGGPLTEDDLLMIEVLGEYLRKKNRGTDSN
jgi:hypothetical protein